MKRWIEHGISDPFEEKKRLLERPVLKHLYNWLLKKEAEAKQKSSSSDDEILFEAGRTRTNFLGS